LGKKAWFDGSQYNHNTAMTITTSHVYISQSKILNAGRGVFAAKIFKKGDIIENCPIIDLSENDYPHLQKTKLRNYYFMWNKTNTRSVLALGYGMLYNHSYTPSATYVKDHKNGLVIFKAIEKINVDEEITANYNYGDPNDTSKLWIEDIPEE